MPIGGSSGGGGKADSNAIKAGEAFVEVSAKDNITGMLNKIAGKLKSVGMGIAKIGVGIAGAGTAILAPLIGLFHEAADRADKFQDLADKLDATTESLSRLGYAAELSGSDMDGVEKAATLLSKANIMAAKGTQEQVDAMNALGVSADDFASMDLDEKFLRIATVLDSMQSPLEKNRLLLALFGKSGASLKPLFSGGAEGLRELLDEADKVGATVKGDDAKKAAKVMDAFDRSWKAAKYTILSVGGAIFEVAGGLENASKVIVNVANTIRTFIENNRTLILTITAVAAGMVAAGLVIAGLGLAIAAVGYVITSAIAIWSALIAAIVIFKAVAAGAIAIAFAPMTIAIVALVAAMAGLAAMWLELGDTTGGVAGAMSQWFNGVLSAFTTMWGGITAAIGKGDLQLAWDIAMKGLRLAWNETVLVFTKMWVGFKRVFVEGFHEAVNGIQTLFMGMIGFIKIALLSGIKFILEKLVWAAKKLGATDVLKGLGANPEAAIQKLDNEINDTVSGLTDKLGGLEGQFNREQTAREAAREEEITGQQAFIDQLRGELNDLVAKAKEKPEVKKDDRKFDVGIKPDDIKKLATAVQGTFGSSNYRGSLGLMGGKTEAEKQTGLLEKMDKKLGGIEAKIDVPEFE